MAVWLYREFCGWLRFTAVVSGDIALVSNIARIIVCVECNRSRRSQPILRYTLYIHCIYHTLSHAPQNSALYIVFEEHHYTRGRYTSLKGCIKESVNWYEHRRGTAALSRWADETLRQHFGEHKTSSLCNLRCGQLCL